MKKGKNYKREDFDEVQDWCEKNGYVARIYHEQMNGKNHHAFTKSMLGRRLNRAGICDVLICKPNYKENRLNVQFEIRFFHEYELSQLK